MEIVAELLGSLFMMTVIVGGFLFIGVLWKAFKALGIWIDKNDRGLK